MDDIQKRDDDQAWDKKQHRPISNLNRKDDEPLCDLDDASKVGDQDALRDKIIGRLIQIEDTISRNRGLANDVRSSIQNQLFPWCTAPSMRWRR